jgi:hypothetical protein
MGFLRKRLAGEITLKDNVISGHYSGDDFHAHDHEEEIAAGDWPHLSLADDYLRLIYDGQDFSPIAGYENHPMTLVTWFGARAYCDFYDWRLPMEVEREKGARGTDGRPYPWSDNIAPHNANYYSSHDPYEASAASLGDTTPVGFYNGRTYGGHETIDSPSPYGLYDMAGLVDFKWLYQLFVLLNIAVGAAGIWAVVNLVRASITPIVTR